MFKEKSIILFQGDSITDRLRSREDLTCLGLGYPAKIGNFFSTFYADCKYTLINRAVSGNTSGHLIDRWEEDAIAIKPDVLS